jgi:hypothetical protein
MDEPPVPPALQRNPVTHARHRREVFWQITLPAAIVATIIFLMNVLATQLGYVEASVWSSISIIFLIIPSIAMALLCTAVMLFVVYGLFMLVRFLPQYSYLAQDRFWFVNLRVGAISNRLTAPFMHLNVYWTTLRSFGGALGRRMPGRNRPKN